MRSSSFPRALIALAIAATGLGAFAVPSAAASAATPAEVTECHVGTLDQQRTEVDVDLLVPGFDPSLGTLLEVTVPTQVVHLDTDAVFENHAPVAETFAAHMDYQVVLTSPGGLASPPALTGTIERVPTQSLAAYDGTPDFAGPSAVAQPSTARDATAVAVQSSDPGVLGAFQGGPVAFHVATTISEVFTGGGGNVAAQINTFASAAVTVCYRYAPVVIESDEPTPPPVPPAATPRLPETGRATTGLALAGGLAVAIGLVLTRRTRPPRPQLDGI